MGEQLLSLNSLRNVLATAENDVNTSTAAAEVWKSFIRTSLFSQLQTVFPPRKAVTV